MAHFFDLSAELRIRIYHFAFRDLRVRYEFNRVSKQSVTAVGTDFLFVCRRLHEEVKSAFLSTAHIDVGPYDFGASLVVYRVEPSLLRYVALDLLYARFDKTLDAEGMARVLSRLISLRELTYYDVIQEIEFDRSCVDDLDSDRDTVEDFVQRSVLNLKGRRLVMDQAAKLVGQYSSHPILDNVREVAGLTKYWKSTNQGFKLIAQVQMKIADYFTAGYRSGRRITYAVRPESQ